ncbi:MAG: acyl carrier protein [Candidatus Omnitrophota bacterium]
MANSRDVVQIAAVINEIVKDAVGLKLKEDEPLLMTHRIDSMDVVEIATAMEKKFDLKIEGEEVNFENFDSVSKMSAFVSRKLSEKETGK